MLDPLAALPLLRSGRSRSITAENPTGAPGGGAQAAPGDDVHCTDAARDLGRGWKVRPCLRNLAPGERVTLAAIDGPGVVRHLWCTVLPEHANRLRFRVFHDDDAVPVIDVPLGAFFANGLDGVARVTSIPVAVLPRSGMNAYWPMPFGRSIRVEVEPTGGEPVPELFYQVDYELTDVADDAARLHAAHRRGRTRADRPEHVLLDDVAGPGHYVGTYLVWHQHAPGWWGEGEVKFFLDDDPADAPTICGTGTEDYFGGAWGFTSGADGDETPVPYSAPYLGYPQWIPNPAPGPGEILASHALYRWHVPDPIRFRTRLRATVQALGWRNDGTYRPLEDEIESVALWYALR
jgi:hypothetical protein